VDPCPQGSDSQSRFADRDRDPQRRLRIGYVSADFRSHSVASFIEPVIAGHDRGAVEVVCYSDAIADAVTERIRNEARPDGWCETRAFSDAALAEKIADDEIDVLIDLAGHTAGNRLLCFARRPAPVQVTYCGYPNTTGLAAMGWRLTDDIADPPVPADGAVSADGAGPSDRHCVERLWRLPHGFLCFRPDPDAGVPSPAPVLAEDRITFGSFNNLAKLGPDVLDLWAAVLKTTPWSRILLKARALSDTEVAGSMRQAFADRGIDPERVEIAPYAASPREHLALYRRVDIALDPFPYNGTTTTCEALWMGVPVVTLRGSAHAGRVGASLLHRVDCDELVAESAEDYLRITSRLAGERDRLVALRSNLRQRMAESPLTNPAIIARDLEAAFRSMWRDWCST
jgi:predicted O-linked N-acetylglucosamine transferase (SPINDLY family)